MLEYNLKLKLQSSKLGSPSAWSQNGWVTSLEGTFRRHINYSSYKYTFYIKQSCNALISLYRPKYKRIP